MYKIDFVYLVTRWLEFFYEYKRTLARLNSNKYEAKARFYDRLSALTTRTRDVYFERGVKR